MVVVVTLHSVDSHTGHRALQAGRAGELRPPCCRAPSASVVSCQPQGFVMHRKVIIPLLDALTLKEQVPHAGFLTARLQCSALRLSRSPGTSLLTSCSYFWS